MSFVLVLAFVGLVVVVVLVVLVRWGLVPREKEVSRTMRGTIVASDVSQREHSTTTKRMPWNQNATDSWKDGPRRPTESTEGLPQPPPREHWIPKRDIVVDDVDDVVVGVRMIVAY